MGYVYPTNPYIHRDDGPEPINPGPYRSDYQGEPTLLPINSFPIASDHPFVLIWNSRKVQVIEALQRLRIAWSTISVVRRGQLANGKDSRVTIVVTADLTKGGAFRELNQVIFDVFKAPQVLVETVDMPSPFSRFGDHAGVSWATKVHSFTDPSERFDVMELPHIGASIGLQGITWSSGTLGGFLRLSKAGRPDMICAVTNHHVLQPKLAKEESLRWRATEIVAYPQYDSSK